MPQTCHIKLHILLHCLSNQHTEQAEQTNTPFRTWIRRATAKNALTAHRNCSLARIPRRNGMDSEEKLSQNHQLLFNELSSERSFCLFAQLNSFIIILLFFVRGYLLNLITSAYVIYYILVAFSLLCVGPSARWVRRLFSGFSLILIRSSLFAERF